MGHRRKGFLQTAVVKTPFPVAAWVARRLFSLPPQLRARIIGAPIRVDGHTLDPQMQLMLQGNKLQGTRSLIDGLDIGAARAAMRKSSMLISTHVGRSVLTRELTIEGGDGPLGARLYTPFNAPAITPLVVFYHGGGFALGDLDSHDGPARFIAEETGYRVLSVEYRLAPEHMFPAAVVDAVAAFEWAYAHAAELGADSSALSVSGDSAGGNLAAVVCHLLAAKGGPMPVSAALFYPACGDDDESLAAGFASRELFGRGFLLSSADEQLFTEKYVAEADLNDPRVALLRQTTFDGLPPMHIAVAEFDILRDGGEKYQRLLASHGVPATVRRATGLIHGFISYVGISDRARDETRAILALLVQDSHTRKASASGQTPS